MAASKRHQGAPVPMPDFIPFQLCKLVARPPEGEDWLHEVKFDGYRMEVRVEQGRATIRTREGHDWTDKFRHLEAVAGELPDCIIDGELCAIGDDGQPDFSALRSAIARRQTDDLVLFAFDLLFEGRNNDLRSFAIGTRKTRLRQILEAAGEHVETVIRYVEEVHGAPAGLLKAACAMKLEGIVSKRRGEPYRSGRTDVWVKAKCRPGLEVVLGGWRQEGSRFNSVLAGIPDQTGGLRYVGRVHTGYSAAVLDQLLPALKAREVADSPFTSGPIPRRIPGVHWVRPGLVADVEMAEFTASGKLRQAAFKALRLDKSIKDLNPEGTDRL
jgi:bifunctional non-homologous end joining protein LigD